MSELQILTVENGFIVHDGSPRITGTIGRSWAFETAESLSEFISAWGNENTKTKIGPEIAASK